MAAFSVLSTGATLCTRANNSGFYTSFASNVQADRHDLMWPRSGTFTTLAVRHLSSTGITGGLRYSEKVDHFASASSGELRRITASSSSSGQVTTSSAEDDVASHRKKLKEKLLAAIEAAEGNLNDECLGIVAELEKVNPNVAVLEKDPDVWLGLWEGIRANFKGSGRKGEAKAEVGYKGAPVTLGRLTFNRCKPATLPVQLQGIFHQLNRDGEDASRQISTFSFDNPRGADLPPIEGIVFNMGTHTNVSPSRQEIVFKSTVLRPLHPEKDLEVWKETFADNVGMDEEGQVVAQLPNPKGAEDYLYIDADIRITRGSRGATVVVRRVVEPKPEFQLSFGK